MVKVNQETCIGCGACASIASDVFELVNGKANVKAGQEGNSSDSVKNAISSCPVNAIE